MNKHLKRLRECLYCHGEHVQKNGQLPKGWQRFRCTDCHKQFTLWGVRWTYDEAFRKKVVDAYCHNDLDARSVAQKYELSTSTIVAWAKKHRKDCDQCN